MTVPLRDLERIAYECLTFFISQSLSRQCSVNVARWLNWCRRSGVRVCGKYDARKLNVIVYRSIIYDIIREKYPIVKVNGTIWVKLREERTNKQNLKLIYVRFDGETSRQVIETFLENTR